jgi:hypothetical protein
MVPVRGDPDVFVITLYRRYPLPVPRVSTSWTQDTLVDAIHWQFPMLVVTVSLGGGEDAAPLGSGETSGAPCSGTETLAGEMETLQTVSESCLTVTVLPATCKVPVRGPPVLFCVTLYSAYPFPEPLEVSTCIQDRFVDAVQPHSALLAVTLILGGRPAPARGSVGSGRP